MKKIVSLSLLLFAPFLSANSITFSSPQQPSVTLKLEELNLSQPPATPLIYLGFNNLQSFLV